MVWKIIWKDSLKFDGKMQNVSQLLPMIFVMDLIMYLKSTHQLIICLFYMMTILLFAFFPIKLAKGLYLCPLTEEDRKRYLMAACYIRFGMLLFMYEIVLFVSGIFLKVDIITLLLQSVFGGLIIFTMTLLYIHPNVYSMETAMQTYYSARKIPIHIRPRLMKLNKKTAGLSVTLLIVVLVLGMVGIILPPDRKELNPILWFYYIPAFICSVICIIIYYKKYLDVVITFYANQENYHYLKKKAGAFHAD